MDGMRITQRMTAARTLAGLESNQAALTRLQQEVSSGKVITQPSDDPAGTVSALQLRGEISRQEQWARNANDGVGWLGTLDTALTSANSTLRRVRDLPAVVRREHHVHRRDRPCARQARQRGRHQS